MRGMGLAFIGLVALIASCSSYGESETDPEAPAGTDGGGASSGSPARDGALDGPGDPVLLPDGGTLTPDDDSGVIGGGTGAPKIVQAAGTTFAGSSNKLAIGFPRPVASGSSILVCAGGSGAKVSMVGVDTVVFDSLMSAGPFGFMSTWIKTIPGNTLSTVNILFENVAANPSAIAVELENAGGHSQTTNSGTGNIIAGGMPMKPNELLFACVFGNGVTPNDPIGAKAVTDPQGNSGQTMVAAATLITVDTAPKITWTTSGAFQWDAISIAFSPAK